MSAALKQLENGSTEQSPNVFSDEGPIKNAYLNLISKGNTACAVARMIIETEWGEAADPNNRLPDVIEFNKHNVQQLENAAYSIIEVMESKITEQAQQIATLKAQTPS